MMQYPVRRGEIYNQLAGVLSKPFLAGEKTWGTLEEVEERFSIACEALRKALPAMLSSNARFELRDRLPAQTWVKGRMLLVGDAAHPMMPFVGQGGCQALEDAAALGALVRHFGNRRSGQWIEHAFRACEAIRSPRAARLQRESRVFGDIWHFEGSAALVRDELFRRKAPDDYRYTDRLYLPGFEGESTPASWLAGPSAGAKNQIEVYP